MVTLRAEFAIDTDLENRRTPRRKLKLVAEARNSDRALRATIEDLSRTGMLLDSPVELSEGDTIDVELPLVGPITAHIKWTRGSLAGCQFVETLPQSAVSASLLLSPHLSLQDQAAPTPYARTPRRDLSGVALGMMIFLLLGVLMLILGMLLA